MAVPVTGLDSPPAASAAVVDHVYGRPGQISVPAAVGDYQLGGSRTVLPNRWVWRSSSTSGTQFVSVTYRLWAYERISGTWSVEQSVRTPTVTIREGYARAVQPGWIFYPRLATTYHIDMYVTWQSPAGHILGQMRVDQNLAQEYRCSWSDGIHCKVQRTGSNVIGIYLA